MPVLNRFLAASAILLVFAPIAAAQPAHQIADLNPGFDAFDPSFTSVFHFFTPVGDRAIFLAFLREDVQCGLWVTDGTAAGTERLTDLCAESLNPAVFNGRLRVLGTTGEVAFLVDGEQSLWRTDGTSGGTFPLGAVKVADTPTAAAVGLNGRTLLFSGCIAGQGCEPWRSDGTPGGTRPLGDLRPGPQGSDPSQFTPFAGGALFALRSELWFSDGTRLGTVRLAALEATIVQIVPHRRQVYVTTFNGGSNLWRVDPQAPASARRLRSFPSDWRSSGLRVHSVGGRVLLHQNVPEDSGVELWETDGTRRGTRHLAPPERFDAGLGPLAGLGKRVVFAASQVDFLRADLWVLEPGATRPHLLRNCPDGCPKVPAEVPLVPFQGRLYFPGFDVAHGLELWQTDGSGSGTRRVADLCPGACDGAPAGLRQVLGHLLFTDAAANLWATNGTAAGTVRLGRIPEAISPWGPPLDAAVAGERVVFSGFDPRHGPQPWTSDLTPAGSEPIVPLDGGLAAGSRILEAVPLGARSVFLACDGTRMGVWVSDGTPGGTLPLPVTEKPCTPILFSQLTAAGSLVFFSWDERLWRTDGTPAGTFPLGPPGFPFLRNPTSFQGRLLFVEDQDTPVPPWFWKFWTSDGTEAGTGRQLELELGGTPGPFAPVPGGILFIAQSPDSPFPLTLWRTDLTAAGTRPLLNVTSNFTSFLLPDAVRLGERTFFVTGTPGRHPAGPEIWVTDGTAAGTAPLIPDLAAPRPRNPRSLASFRGSLYFFAETGNPASPLGLWRSDGTAAGTVLLAAWPLTSLSLLIPVGDRLFFRAADREHGLDLWVTDGTPAGTVLVRDIAPGPKQSRLAELTAAGGRLHFTASDGEHGLELWVSDGTAAGTRLVQDILPGISSSSPERLTAVDGWLFFTANDGEHGREPWALPVGTHP